MKIPVVLSVVHVVIDPDGVMEVDVDGVPRDSEQGRSRGGLRTVIDEITAELGVPVRVEVREADGSTYADIATPPELPAPAAAESSPTPPSPTLAGTGFQAGEEVAVAYVVARQSADAEGNASLNLPPALLAATRGGLVLLGMSSQTVTRLEPSA